MSDATQPPRKPARSGARSPGTRRSSARRAGATTRAGEALDLGSDKLYFKIGEAAEIVGVAPHVLRYWESEFRAVRPQKSRSQQRVYRRKDVETLLRIKHLLYVEKFTIAGARKQLKERKEDVAMAAPSATYRARQSLASLRGQVFELLDLVRREAAPDPSAADPASYLRERGGAEQVQGLRAELEGTAAPLLHREPRTPHS